MSSTATATSPSAAVLRLPASGPLLTAFSSTQQSEDPERSPSAPRHKRRRLDAPNDGADWEQEETFMECLNTQVFPHIDAALHTLPQNVDRIKLGGKVTQLLTGPDSNFVEKYKRGNGRLSPGYERELVAQAFEECARLAELPENQIAPPDRSAAPSPQPWATLAHAVINTPTARASNSLPRHENHIAPTGPSSATFPQPWATLDHAVINTPTARARPKLPAQRVSNGPYMSSSPIPIPQKISLPNAKPPTRPSNLPVISTSPIPPPAIPKNHHRPSMSALRVAMRVASTAGQASSVPWPSAVPGHLSKATGKVDEPIVLDSDSDGEPNTQTHGANGTVDVPGPRGDLLPQRKEEALPSPGLAKKPLPPVETEKESLSPNPAVTKLPPVEAGQHVKPPPVEERPAHRLPEGFKSTQDCYTLWKNAYGLGRMTKVSSWFTVKHRPYLSFQKRREILDQTPWCDPSDLPLSDDPVHVDFTDYEVNTVYSAFRRFAGQPAKERVGNLEDLRRFMRRWRPDATEIVAFLVESNALPRRKKADIFAFLKDVDTKKTYKTPPALRSLQMQQPEQAECARNSHVHTLLFARETSGYHGYRGTRQMVNFHNEFRNCREDDLTVRSEWTDCAGDIATIAWVSNDGFICGTTEHSDSHNQQYNKPGNLVLGSCRQGTLRAYPEHRIVRPIVAKGENASEEMRESQDPWLYSSVVSSDYDAAHNRAFTSGFDSSVKVWSVNSGAAMEMIGEWKHGGNVNFVAASKHFSSGAPAMVATASDVPADAVRVYSIQEGVPISASPYRSYSCSRVTDADGNTVSTEKWAYYPATMQWGLAERVKHLLLIGYSPRSRTGDDHDIPEDRRQTGELCLWDGRTGERWRLTSATTANVFEVLWHPNQECFIAATTPIGLEVDSNVRTQIRVFRISDSPEYSGKAFSPVKTLDCRAADINELTMVPNSFSFCYVTAGCTDGAVYIWDTALSDKPIHILRHGKPIEEFSGDREREDVGVKFTAWGTTLDRFYTGSSDGVVKVWNVRALKKPFVRDLLQVPSAVSCGMFSPDHTKLVIGDASGRVFLLSLDPEDVKPASHTTIRLPGTNETRTIRCPAAIIPHPEPPPPAFDALGRPLDPHIGRVQGEAYLRSGQLQRHPNPTVGVVQGPNYAHTGLFWNQGHLNGDPAQPLLATWAVKQQDARGGIGGRGGRGREMRPLRQSTALAAWHERNRKVDLQVEALEPATRRALEAEGAELEVEDDCYGFAYEEEWGSEEGEDSSEDW